jgi:Cu+-exporting ATPase
MDGKMLTTSAQMEQDHQHIRFDISGMTCGGCAGRVERVLKDVPGVTDALVNLATESAIIDVSNQAPAINDDIITAVEKAGFSAKPHLETYSAPISGDAAIDSDPFAQSRLIFAVVLSLPFAVQMLSMLTPLHFELSPWVQFALATPVQFVAASRFYRPAWYALKAASGNMDLLVVLGTLSTWGLSTYLLLTTANPALYFEASASVITLILLGKWLESKAKRSSASAIRALMNLRPQTARVRKDDTDIEIPVSDVRVNDIIVVKPGEKIPVDGLILHGASHINEALITGESMPVARDVGSSVTGGAVNGEGLLIFKTAAVGRDTTLSKIINLVEQAQAGKAPVQRLVDRISQVFVPFIMVIAITTFIGWQIAGLSVEGAIINAVTVLVIACPCALGLATPTAIMVGTGVAAKNGILIRDIEVLERARQVSTVVFDKTGTLTEGEPRVSDVFTNQVSERELLQLAASAQQGSEHPLARAVINKAHEQTIELKSLSSFKSQPGRGIAASVAGQNLMIGSERYMDDNDISIQPLNTAAEQCQQRGKTLVWVASKDQATVLGLLALDDSMRASSTDAIRQLHDAGVDTVMLSGDSQNSARSMAELCGISRVIAEVLPDEKAFHITEMQNDDNLVAMVGDGLNDAPALAAADVGIAMGSGTDVAIETAGITLMRADPSLVADALSISSRTYNKIRQNLFWAFIYNVIALPLAAAGQLSPVIAGAAMALSSVSVVSNSLLLKRWKRGQIRT